MSIKLLHATSLWMIRDTQGRYLTGVTPGKSRRGWSNGLNRAAKFNSYEVASWTRDHCCGKVRGIIEEMKS